MIHPKLREWWEGKVSAQAQEIEAARMPDSLEDAENPAEFMKFRMALPEDSPSFIQIPESHKASSNTDLFSANWTHLMAIGTTLSPDRHFFSL